MKRLIILCASAVFLLCGCVGKPQTDAQPMTSATDGTQEAATGPVTEEILMYYTAQSKIADVTNDSAFGSYGRLIFPVDEWYYSGENLGDLSLTWYGCIDPDKTVEICNYFKAHAEAGDVIFYDIYTEAEKHSDPEKEDTGLFFFKGKPGAKFAVCNAGGGFAYGRYID